MCFSQRTVPLQLRRAPSLDSSRDERAGSVNEAEELGGDENGQAEHAEDDPENERVERASELAFLVGERVDVLIRADGQRCQRRRGLAAPVRRDVLFGSWRVLR